MALSGNKFRKYNACLNLLLTGTCIGVLMHQSYVSLKRTLYRLLTFNSYDEIMEDIQYLADNYFGMPLEPVNFSSFSSFLLDGNTNSLICRKCIKCNYNYLYLQEIINMRISSFVAGQNIQQYNYKSFEPNNIDLPWEVDDVGLTLLLSQADIKLGELNAYSQLIPDVDFFIKMHVLKEGTQSSRIEGTQTNIDEAVQKEEFIQPEKRGDWQEVQNYVLAMNHAIQDLEKLPISNRLLKQVHRILMQGVRGTNKLPGEFRKSQNWIGGSSLTDASFIPPHQDNIPDLMSDLEIFYTTKSIRCLI